MTRANPTPPRLRPKTRLGAHRRVAPRREPQPPAWRAIPARTQWRSPAGPKPVLAFPVFGLCSLAAHLLIAALLIFWPDPRPSQDLPPAPPSIEIVFESGQPERPVEEPVEGIDSPPQPPSPPNQAEPPPPPNAPPLPSQPALPPVQQALPLPPPPAPLPPPPMPAPPIAAPPVQQAQPVPQPPQPEPPATAQAPLPPLPGAIELFTTPTELRLPDRLAETLPLPPLPLPTPPQPQQPPSPPRPQQRPQEARPNLPGIWAPGGVQLGRPATPPAGRPQARGTDLTVDPRFLEGRPRTDPSVRVTGAQVGADWRAAFRRWLDQNISYPQRAIALGEDGTVRVVVTASPDGTVRNVRLAGPSTSPSLNFGTTFPFNGARLPAFPPGSDPNGVTIELTVNYILVRR